jgi:hypothetical protein
MDLGAPMRRRKTARERREQRLRAEGRVLQRLVAAFRSIQQHRGQTLSTLGISLMSALQGHAMFDVDGRHLPSSCHVALGTEPEGGKIDIAGSNIRIDADSISLECETGDVSINLAAKLREKVHLTDQPVSNTSDFSPLVSDASIPAFVPRAAQPDYHSGEITLHPSEAVAAASRGQPQESAKSTAQSGQDDPEDKHGMQCDEDYEEEGEEEEEESEEDSEEDCEEDSETDTEGDSTDGAEDNEKLQKTEIIAQAGKKSEEGGEHSTFDDEFSSKKKQQLCLDELTVGADVVVDRSVYTLTNIGYGRYHGQVRIEDNSGFGYWILKGEIDSIVRSGVVK